jgi:hypothetical protein
MFSKDWTPLRLKKGTCRLQPDEVSRGLGLPKDPQVDISLSLLDRSTCLIIFEALLESLQNLLSNGPSEDGVQTRPGFRNVSGGPEVPKPPPFKWTPPDLFPEGAWHQKRLMNH